MVTFSIVCIIVIETLLKIDAEMTSHAKGNSQMKGTIESTINLQLSHGRVSVGPESRNFNPNLHAKRVVTLGVTIAS